jgi:hypothetical protein
MREKNVPLDTLEVKGNVERSNETVNRRMFYVKNRYNRLLLNHRDTN